MKSDFNQQWLKWELQLQLFTLDMQNSLPLPAVVARLSTTGEQLTCPQRYMENIQ